jgi:methionine-rich copper-binding protein CopC
MTGFRHILLTLLLLGIALPGTARHILAAGELIGSNPANGATLATVPERIELTFDETIDPEMVQIVVIAPNGARADTGVSETSGDSMRATTLRAGLADGRYLVYWLVAEPGTRAAAFGDLSFTVAGASPCQPPSKATPRPPAENCIAHPPTGAPGEPIVANGISVTIATSGNQAGPIDLQATVTDDAGNPIGDAVVWFRARHLEMDHGELPYLAEETGPGVYQTGGVGMGMGGNWRIAVDVILPGQPPVTVFVEQAMVE